MSDQMDIASLRAAAEQMTETTKLGATSTATVTPLKAIAGLKFPFEMIGDIQITSTPEWAIEGLLPRQGLAAVYGAPGGGKSFLAIDAAGHIAAGLPWFGRDVEQGGVVYIAAEAGSGLRKRLAAWKMEHKVQGPLPLALVTVAPNLGTTKDGSDTKQLIDELRRQAPTLGFPIRVIVVDTLARALFGADENSAADMGAFVANAGMIADAFGCLVIAVHHSGKDAERGMRGSSALHGACDSEWEIRDGQGGEKVVSLVKNKEGEDGLSWSFRLTQKTVFDPAEMGGATVQKVALSAPVTSCIVETVTEPQQLQKVKRVARPSPREAVILDAVREALGRHGAFMPGGEEYPSGRGVKDEFVKEIAYLGGFGEGSAENSRRAALSACLTNLKGKGLIGRQGEWVWLCD